MTDPNQPPPYQPPPPSPPPSPSPPSSPPPSPQPSSSPPPSPPSSPSSSSQQYPPVRNSYQPSTYPQAYGTGPEPGSGSTGGSVPGRTLGIVALVGSILLSFFSVVWLILGIVGLVRSRRAGAPNGFAIAAIVVSIVAFIVWVIAAVTVIVGIVSVAQLCAQYGSGTYEINGNPVQISCG